MAEPVEQPHIGELIAAERRAKGYSQARLATLADLSPQAIQFIETGKRTPRVATLMAIKAALDLPDETFSTWLEVAA